MFSGLRFRDVRRVTETASTNDDVMALARAGAAEGVVVVADHQTAGRGRQGRTWLAPPGSSLLVTVLLRPPAPGAPFATTVAGLALADAVHAVSGVTAALKWPNDLVVHDRKLAGLLAEADWGAGGAAAVAVAVGAGVNLTWPRVMPPEIAASAIALSHLAAGPVDRDALLAAYLEGLEAWYSRLLAGGPAPLLAAWRSRSATLGREVRVALADRDVTGTAVAIDDRGHLVVELASGEHRTFAAGDVLHLRPTP